MKCECVCTCGSHAVRPPKVDRRKFWTEEKLLAAIVGLDGAGISLKVAAIENDSSTRSREVLFEAIGKRIHPLTVYNASRRQGYVWKHLCIKADAVNASRMKSLSDAWSSDLTIKVIREMYAEGFPMNCKAIRFKKEKTRSALILRLTGTDTNGAGVYKRAVTRFGNWKTALLSSGLQPENIKARRKLSAKSRSAHLPAHQETVIDEHGRLRSAELIGFAPRTPEEILSHQHELRALDVALSALSDEDRGIAEKIVSLLLRDSGIETLEDAIDHISTADHLTRRRIRKIFDVLRDGSG